MVQDGCTSSASPSPHSFLAMLMILNSFTGLWASSPQLAHLGEGWQSSECESIFNKSAFLFVKSSNERRDLHHTNLIMCDICAIIYVSVHEIPPPIQGQAVCQSRLTPNEMRITMNARGQFFNGERLDRWAVTVWAARLKKDNIDHGITARYCISSNARHQKIALW